MANQTVYPYGQGGQMPSTIPIADDLETNRADVSLSAKQGKILNETKPTIGDESNADLDITDEVGNVLARFSDGHFKVKNFDTRHNQSQVLDDSEADFDITDEDDYAIVRFKGGHVKTKNFNSLGLSNFTAEKFVGKRIAILGDSISTFNGWLPSNISGYTGANYITYYPQGSVTSVKQTWWYKVAVNLGLNPAEAINNCAWSGSCVTTTWSNVRSDSTASAAPGCSTRRISDLSIRGWIPDIVLVFISCNDWSIDTPLGDWKVSDAIPEEGLISTFRAAYSLMLNKIHIAYPLARIFCMTNLDDLSRDRTAGWPSNNRNNVSTYEWNRNIIEIAHAFGCDTIDVHNCGMNYANLLSYVVDAGLHPNEYGMELIAKRVTNELILKY